MAIERFPQKPVERPTTTIVSDTSAITGASTGSDKILMLIGEAEGGQPNQVYKVRNYIQAKKIFRGGELLDAMELAWNPANETQGAGDILAMRVENATNATFKQGPVTFESKLYGDEANQINVELAESESGNGRNLTVTGPGGYRNVYYDLGHIFSVTFEGEGEASIEVADNKVIVTDGANTVTLLAEQLPKVNQVVNQINQIKGFKATMPARSNKNIDTADLDDLAVTVVGAEPVKVTGLIADLKLQLQYDEMVTISVDGAGAVEDFNETLEGGSNGEVPVSWADKFAHFANEGGYYLVPLTDSPAVHAEGAYFVNERSNQGEPMRMISGAGIQDNGEGETADALLNRASALRDSRAYLVGFAGEATMGDGQVKAIPGYMFAAQVAGIASGLDIGESITFKQINISNVKPIFEGSELDALNTGGVIMAEFVRNRLSTKFRLVDDVSTYNDKTDPVRSQLAVGEAHDFLASELKLHLDENFIGSRTEILSPSILKNSIQSFLDQKKRDREIQDYDPQEVQVVIDGEVAEVSLVVFPMRSLKRINVSLIYKQQVLTSY